MQLDAWDADTSVPAILDGEHSVLYRKHYDRQSDADHAPRLIQMNPSPETGYLFPRFSDISYT